MFSKLKRYCVKNFVSDRRFVEWQYRSVYGHFPNLVEPRTFDEKIQWYKLYYRKPAMTGLVDKYNVRQYVTQKNLGHILNELYGVYDRAEEINFETLSDAFVLKATHGSAMNIICKNKREPDLERCRKILKGWLGQNYYDVGREWVYKDIKPRIICEKYLENEEHHDLIDYKFYCYGGKPEAVFVCCNRFGPTGVKYDGYDMQWNKIPVYKGRPAAGLNLARPGNFDEMIDVATRLSEGFPFIRVDLYSVNNRIYFGELTFYPDNGLVPFSPDKYNYFFGDLFVLPEKIN